MVCTISNLTVNECDLPLTTTMGSCQCPVDLAVQLAQAFADMLIVLFEQNKMYVCVRNKYNPQIP